MTGRPTELRDLKPWQSALYMAVMLGLFCAVVRVCYGKNGPAALNGHPAADQTNGSPNCTPFYVNDTPESTKFFQPSAEGCTASFSKVGGPTIMTHCDDPHLATVTDVQQVDPTHKKYIVSRVDIPGHPDDPAAAVRARLQDQSTCTFEATVPAAAAARPAIR